jgi:hypothetical protein
MNKPKSGILSPSILVAHLNYFEEKNTYKYGSYYKDTTESVRGAGKLIVRVVVSLVKLLFTGISK